MERDLYDTLGVARNANQEEIKKAFRKLARTYHPDFNPGDKVAERKFKEAQEAYEILGDATRRGQYDRFGLSYFRRHDGTPPPKKPQDIVNEFMEAMLKREFPQRRRGEDLKYYLTVTLEEAALGTEKVLTIPRELECEVCRGTGADRKDGKVPCETCQGLGEIRPSGGLFNFRRPCTSCRGTGYRIVIPCPGCNGSGRQTRKETIKVKVPMGVDTGQRLKLRDRGNGGHRGGEVGDLYVIVHVRDHEIFRRQGTELLCDIPISFTQAALGGMIDVPTLQGTARIEIPPGVQTGKLYRLKGQGLPRASNPGPGPRGDLHVRIVVETPVNLSSEQRRILEELDRASAPGATPIQSGFIHKLRARLQGEG